MRPLVLLVTCVLTGTYPRAARAADTFPPPTIVRREDVAARAIDSLLAAPEMVPTHVGIAVRSLDYHQWLVLHDADKLFVPASNTKLLVAAAALYVLGPQARFSTAVMTDAAVIDSILAGDVYLVARGAPDLVTGQLVTLAGRLRALGVRRIDGALVLDATYFDSTAFGPGWMWDEGPVSYNAPVNAFMLNDNTVTITARPGPAPDAPVRVEVTPADAGIPVVVTALTRGRTTDGPPLVVERPRDAFVVRGTLPIGAQPIAVDRSVPDPAGYAGAVFAGALRRMGVTLVGPVRAGAAPASARTLAEVPSALADFLVRRFLKESHNLTGEALVKQLGVATNRGGTWRGGLAAIRAALADLANVDPAAYYLADGSGLSRYTEVSPRTFVEVIAAAADRFSMSPEFLAALSIGGTDGTLVHRLGEGDMAGQVRAKTGTMHGVSCLSGIVVTRAGERLAFSILMNGFTGSAAALWYTQEEIVAALRGIPPPWAVPAGSP